MSYVFNPRHYHGRYNFLPGIPAPTLIARAITRVVKRWDYGSWAEATDTIDGAWHCSECRKPLSVYVARGAG